MNKKSTGDFDYDARGHDYAQERRTDPRIAARIHAALGDARTVLNVGAGAGSYEPEDRYVIALEPSLTMRAQRPANLPPAIHGIAENLPLDDQSVDACMATLTVHQWSDLDKGLSELRRVARGQIVVLTCDGAAFDRFWLADYAPELLEAERRRFPKIEKIQDALGSNVEVQAVAVPIDCVDGFMEAFYARPERLLDPHVRRCQSAWGFVSDEYQRRFEKLLGDDLKSGVWERRYGDWRKRPEFAGSLRLIVRH